MKYLCPICGTWYKIVIHNCPVIGEDVGLDNSGKIYVRKK